MATSGTDDNGGRGDRVSRSQVILLLAFGGRIALAMGVTVLFGRLLDPAAFGFFAFVASIFTVSAVALDLGTAEVAVREIVRDAGRERHILEGLMAWRGIGAALIAPAILVLAVAESEPHQRLILAGVACVLLLSAPAALWPVFVVRQRQGGPALLGVLTQGMVLVGGFVLAGLRVAGTLWGWLLVVREALSLLGMRLLAQRLLGYRLQPGLRGRGLRAFLGMTAVHGLAVLCYAVYFHVDVFLVRLIRPAAELGAYAAAFRPINPLLLLPVTLMLPLLPVLAAAFLADRRRFASQVGTVAALLTGIGALGGCAGVLLAQDVMQVLYGGRYLHGELHAVTAFAWLSVALAAVFFRTAYTVALLSAGQEWALLCLGLLGLVVNVAGNLVLLPVFGFTAAAFATAVTEVVVAAGAVLAFRWRVGSTGLDARYLWALAPAVVLGGAVSFLEGPASLRVLAGAALAAAGVAALLASPAARRFRGGLAEATERGT